MLRACSASASRHGIGRPTNACQGPHPSAAMLTATPQLPPHQGGLQGPPHDCYSCGMDSGPVSSEVRLSMTEIGHMGQHLQQQEKEEQVPQQEKNLKQEQNELQQQLECGGNPICEGSGGCASLDRIFLLGPSRGLPSSLHTLPPPRPDPDSSLPLEEALDSSSGNCLEDQSCRGGSSPIRRGAPPLLTGSRKEAACCLPSGESADEGTVLPRGNSMGGFLLKDVAAALGISHVSTQKTEEPDGFVGLSPLPSKELGARADGGPPAIEAKGGGAPEPSGSGASLSEQRTPSFPHSSNPPSMGNTTDEALPGMAPTAAAAAGEVTHEAAPQQQLGALISAAVDRFESLALRRMEDLMRQTWGPRQMKLRAETDLSMQVNSKLLQSLHLEALNTDDLKVVLALSEEIRLHGTREALPGDSLPPSSPPLHLRPAYSWADPPELSSESPDDFVVTPRGTVRELSGVSEERRQILDAMDERDGFSDILRVCENEGAQGRGPQMVYSRMAGIPPRGKTLFARESRSRRDVSRETAAAAAAAAEFMETSSGRASPSAFGPRAHRRRPRQVPQRRFGGSRGAAGVYGSDDHSECPREVQVKRYCRGTGSRQIPLLDMQPPGSPVMPGIHAPQETPGAPWETPIGPGEGDVTIRLAAGVPPYYVLGAHSGTPGASCQSAPCIRSAYGARRPGLRCSSSGNSQRDTSTSSAAPPTGPSGPLGPPCRGAPGAAAESLFSSCRSPVKGVYYDSFKKLWRVQWHTSADTGGPAAEGKRMSRSFSCSRLGFDLARARAVAWMLSGGLVGDRGGLGVGRIPVEGAPDVPTVCAALATATDWGSVQDCQIKDFAVFFDPRRFLMKVEGYYLAQKLCGGSHTPAPPRLLPSNTNSCNNVSDANNQESEIGGNGPSWSLSPDGRTPPPVAKGSSGGKKGSRGVSASSKQRSLAPISLDKMLEIVWGTPQEAAVCILAEATGDRPPREVEAPQGMKMASERNSTTSTAASAEGCFIKPDVVF